MDPSALAFAFLLLTQAVAGGSPPAPALSLPPAQLPTLPDDAATALPWKSSAGTIPDRPAEPLEPTVSATAKEASPTIAGAPPERLPESSASPPDWVAAALRAHDGGPRGEPISLSVALGGVSDRIQQANVVHAYWRLAQALGLANLARDFQDRLDRLELTAADSATWRSARATAAAAAEETAVDVMSIQCELAALLSRSPEAPLPLPGDSPHVGPYLTHFDRLRSAGRAPASALVIDRRLSILWRAIEARAAAAAAAEDGFRLASTEYLHGGAALPLVVEVAEQAHRQHRALLEVVIRYNRDIAGYAAVVAPAGTTGPALVRMLIEQPPEPLSPIPAADDSAVHATGATEPAAGPRTFAAPSAPAPGTHSLDPRRPTPAVRPPSEPEPAPTPAPQFNAEPRDQTEPTESPMPETGEPGGSDERLPSLLSAPPSGSRPSGQASSGPGQQLSSDDEVKAASAEEPASSPRPVVPVTPEDGSPAAAAPANPLDQPSARPPQGEIVPLADRPTFAPHATFRLGQSDGASSSSKPSLYGPLREASPARCAKQLALTLHWDRLLPEGAGEPLDLASCLGRCRAEDRPKLLATYWQVREAAARYQVLAEQSAWLQAIVEDGLQTASSQASAVDLRLRSARLAAQAEMHEAHAALVQAQFDLAVLLGRNLDDVWPMASTSPHAGPYLARLDEQPAEVAASPAVRRRASVLPQRGEAVQQYAVAVVEADAARADATEKFAAGKGTLDAVEQTIRRQTDQTLAFLRSLSDYNRAIAGYVLAVLPPDVPAETLVSTLVVQ